MAIRQGLLALLQQGPMYGYQLRAEFESRTGATWPLNVGQVYSTLSRLERDGLVEPAGEDDEGHVFYRLTPDGETALASWWASPVSRESSPRDELAIKLALAVTVPGVDVAHVVQAQRTETMRALQQYTRQKAQVGDDDVAWLLVVESLIFQAEAEVRWLDHVEGRLVRARARGAGERAAGSAVSTTRRPAVSRPRAARKAGR